MKKMAFNDTDNSLSDNTIDCLVDLKLEDEVGQYINEFLNTASPENIKKFSQWLTCVLNENASGSTDTHLQKVSKHPLFK